MSLGLHVFFLQQSELETHCSMRENIAPHLPHGKLIVSDIDIKKARSVRS